MKKLNLLKSLFVLIGVLITSVTTQVWANDAADVSDLGIIVSENGTTQKYKLADNNWLTCTNCTDWTIKDWSSYSSHNFGNLYSFKLKGVAVSGWTEGSNWFAAKIQYKIYPIGESVPGDYTGEFKVGNYDDAASGNTNSLYICGDCYNNGTSYKKVIGMDNQNVDLIYDLNPGTYNMLIDYNTQGLYNNSGGSGTYSTSTTISGSVTATFTVMPKVTFSVGGGTISTSYQYVNYNSSTSLTAVSTLGLTPPTGYHFDHWTDGVNNYNDGGSITLTVNETLTAVYAASSYDVILDVNGATTGSDQTVTAIYDAAMPTTQKGSGSAITAPSKTGYDFAGYVANSNGTGIQYYNADLTSNHVWNVATDNTHIYAKWTAQNYTVTFNRNGGVDGTTTSQTVTYNAATTTIPTANLPTYSGKGFDGFWTGEGGTGTQVINDKGEWIASVDGYTDGSKNWIRTSGCTLYARWLTPGYYAVGEFNNWKAQAVMTSTGVTNEVGWESDEILKRTFERDGDMNLKSYFKIRQVAAGAGNTDTWYGLNSDNEFGRDITKTIKSGESNMKLQIYYDGQYTFKLNTSTKSLTVVVPVKNRLEIYNINGATSGTVDGHSIPWYSDDWEDADVSNTVTQTVELERGKYYKFKPVYDSYYYGKSPEVAITYNATPPTTSALVAGEADLKITADLKGDYKFDFNYSTKVLKVTYPTRRLVTYTVSTVRSGNGTESGANGSLMATNDDDSDYDISNVSNYVADGNTVTFTAPAAKSGYTWRGWYSVADPSADYAQNKLSEGTNNYFSTSVSGGNKTVYAVYSEDMYSISVDSTSAYISGGDHGGYVTNGGVKVSSSISNVGVNSYAELTAVPTNEAWRFKEWQFTSNASPASTYTSTSNPIHINATATSQKVTAVFEPRYGLVGSRKATGNPAEGMPVNGSGNTWDNSAAADFVVVSFTAVNTTDGVDLECSRTLLPNRDYKFQVYDRELNTRRGCTTSGGATMDTGKNWELNNSNDVWISTVGYGNYVFHITKIGSSSTYYPSLQVDRVPSSKLTLGWGYAQIDALNTVNSGNTGGSVTAQTNEGSGFAITNGQYVANGSNIIFTAAPATGYTLEGWYNNSDYAVEHKISDGGDYSIDGNTLTVSDIDDDFAIYAKFVETSTAVTFSHNTHGHVTIGGATVTNTTVGVTTTRTITAVPDAGYYFAGWTVPGSADFTVGDASGASDNNSKSTTLTGLGSGTAGTLTAVFEENSKIYFRNVFDDGINPATHWSQVYVYFGVDWHSDQGVHKTGNLTEYAQMQPVATGSYTYWAYIPHAYKDNEKIAFADADRHTAYAFHTHNGVYRTDYKPALNMFVPHHQSSETKNTTTYYSNGYWMNYGEAGSPAGYYIMRYTGSGYENPADNGTGSNQFVIIDENTIQYSLRIDNSSYTHNRFRITSAYGTQYITTGGVEGTAITTENCDNNLVLSEYKTGSPRFSINQTIHGIYVITIDQSGDAMKIRVNYPVALNDYRLVHSYKVRKHDDSADSLVYTYSDVIKNGSTNAIVSMYINTTSAPTLALEKCTAIDPLTWTDQSAGLSINTGTNYFDDGNGVYQFNIAAPGTTNTLSNIKLYDGEFYIKTDIASGGWTAYKANIMEKNSITFDSGDPKTFDYAFCHWVGKARSTGSATNVKCVIANDYNIAVSDTLEHDAIIGDGANKYQTLPSPAHVRFSYNSTTNELKRTYLAVTGDDHLVMEGNTLSGPVYMIKNTSEVEFTDNKATLENQSNFTFGLDIKARETARVRLSAKYNGTIQDLVGHVTSYGSDLTDANTVEIMGGDIKNTGYNTLHVSYDFKTNQLLSAWMAPASGDSPDKAINADVMIIRQEQGDARQITFASNEHNLSAVKKVYGVMKFTKSFILNNGVSRYARDLYWISFPFDVRLSDAFGLGTYGTHWIIEYYDGKGRAEHGFWADSEPNWKFVTPAMREHGGTDGQGFIMNANEGYILALDLDELGGESLVWDNDMTEAYLYFPSKSDVNNIEPADSKEVPIDQVGYQCTINRATPDGDRRIKDSYWHCIGAPSYANVNHDVATEDPTLGGQESWNPVGLMYFYEWNTADNSLDVRKTSPQSFKAMHSYLVQYSSTTLTWANVNKAPASVAARLAETPDREYKLVLQGEERTEDQTFVRLTDETAVSNRFEFNYDLSKEYNAGRGNIWTVTADTVEVAGNSMPKPVQTTVVPVGVKVVANGEYTFSMPEGTNGENVVLIDNAYGTRTNLGLMPYTVTLTAGTYDGRFALEFGPIQDAPTGIEQMSTVNYQMSTEEVRKVFVGGRLYIIRDGKVYDAAGQRVE